MSERFFLDQEYKQNAVVFLEDAEQHHLSRVMRIRENEIVELTNGKGSLALARAQKMGLLILEVNQFPSEKEILLGVPFMRPSKLEWILEKGTEIGVSSFFLYPADKSTQKSLSDHQVQRLNNVIVSSLKQSKRLYLPHLEILLSLEELLAKKGICYFGDVRDSAPLLVPREETPLFISGPESGFSDREVALLEQKAKGVRINPNILRAETAPIVASSIFAHFTGFLNT